MKTTLLAKATMCVCPPALIATAVATVPPVKRAVHHATAPSRPATKVASRRPTIEKATFASIPCAPIADIGFVDSLPLEVTPITLAKVSDPLPIIGPPTTTTAVPPTTVVVDRPSPTTGAVPEPATWAMLIVGFGAVGAVLRSRRVRRLAPAGGLPAPSPVQRRQRYRVSRSGRPIGWRRFVGAGGLLALPSPGDAVTGVATKTTQSALLAKAALCICPAVVLATTAATVPPVRNAIYHATAPSLPPAIPSVPLSAPTCLP